MADSSLDDFFAKKDKRGKKGKAKFTTTDILNQQKEEPKKPAVEKPKKRVEEKPPATEGGDTATKESDPVLEVKSFAVEDEEWKDYESEEKDYSGLRIQNLQITRENQEDSEENQLEGEEEGEDGKRADNTPQGPWKAQAEPAIFAPPPPVEEEPPKQELPKEPEGAVKSGKYIPPGMRAAMRDTGGSGPLAPSVLGRGNWRSHGKKQAPNIQSEEDFPTLGGGPAIPESNAWGSGGGRFEKVRSGGRQTEDPNNTRSQLQLGNKFDALRD